MKRVTCLSFLAILLVSAGWLPGCGTPADRCAAPSRAEIEKMQQEREPSLPPDLLAMRDRWVRESLSWVGSVLLEFPPDTVRQPLRRLALTTLDDALHLISAPDIGATGEFFSRRIDLALQEISGPPPAAGAKVWKLYNHGFVVRTSGHCYGFDINPGVGGTRMSREQMGRLADALEVMFISHRHGDHASTEFAEMMLALGKTVVINPDFWGEKQPLRGKLIRIGGDMSGSEAGISFEVFPGHQDDIPNNVYLVAADGVRVMHTGDQFNRRDLDGWIGAFSDSWRVDILLPNCWTMEIGRLVGSIAPRLVITGHENELGHTVDHRESFAKSYRQLQGLSAPYVLMTWGEMYEWKP